MMRPNSTVEFRIFWFFCSFRIFWISLVLQQIRCAKNDFSWRFRDFWSLSAATVLLCLWTVEHPFAILENSTLRQDWNFDLCLHQISLTIQPVGLEAFSITGLLDAIGLFTSEEFARTEMTKFVGLDSPQSCFLLSVPASFSPSFRCSWPSWNFWHNRENWNGWCWTKWRRLFHSSRVKFPFVKMSAIWCLVSMYLIGILRSKLILPNNQSRATLRVLDTCLIGGLIPLNIILITASWCSNTYNKALDWKNFTFESTLSTWNKSELLRGWSFALILGALAWRSAMQEVTLCWWILGFLGLVMWLMEHFFYQIPQVQSWYSIHA